MDRTKEALLADIRDHPAAHRHASPGALLDCCLNGGNAPDFDVLEAHAFYAPLCTCHLGQCVCAACAAQRFCEAFLLV